MKQLFLLVCMIAMVSIGQSQSCHSMAGASGCCASKAAAMVAAQDAGLLIKKDVATGDISYLKKSCSYSANSSMVEMSFDPASGNFVNKAPTSSNEMYAIPVSSNSTSEVKKMDCSQMSKAECAEKMAKGECHPKSKT
ncbi:MAG: hypothetical protein IPG82_20295 [Saprospiraceae bacterium]|nr:hypothetical protein [Saprospiraceae bacterium]MBK9681659.1 hypothetical protein [Saprospiraceae bacterium]